MSNGSLGPGSTVGPYRIERPLGQGGMATVYLAHDDRLDRQVALKVILDHRISDPAFQERLRREARAAARLRHPDIVTVYDFVESEGVRAIVMEYVDSGTLRERMGPRFSLEDVVRLLTPVADALDYAHRLGFVHRDVKPANILIRENGRPVLSDFGLVRLLEAESGLTATGMTAGTPEYIAPEQALGQTVGPPADVFALAVIAYEMLCGAQPYDADTPVALLVAHAYQEARSPRALVPEIPPAVETALLKGLARSPLDRYQSAGEFMHDLAAAGAPPAAAWPAPAAAGATQVAPAAASPAGGMPAGGTAAAPQVSPPAAVGAVPGPPLGRKPGGARFKVIGGVVGMLAVTGAVAGTIVVMGGGGDGPSPTPTATATATVTATRTGTPGGNGGVVEPGQIVIQRSEVAEAGLAFRQQNDLTLEGVFLTSALAELDADEVETLSAGQGTLVFFDSADQGTTNALISGAFVFEDEEDAQLAMEAMQPLILSEPRSDPDAFMQVTQSVPFDPPTELGSDALAVAEFGTLTGTTTAVQGYTTAWRRGRRIGVLLYVVPAGVDAGEVSARYFEWLSLQNDRMGS